MRQQIRWCLHQCSLCIWILNLESKGRRASKRPVASERWLPKGMQASVLWTKTWLHRQRWEEDLLPLSVPCWHTTASSYQTYLHVSPVRPKRPHSEISALKCKWPASMWHCSSRAPQSSLVILIACSLKTVWNWDYARVEVVGVENQGWGASGKANNHGACWFRHRDLATRVSTTTSLTMWSRVGEAGQGWSRNVNLP